MDASSMTTGLTALPDELKAKVFGFLEQSDLFNVILAHRLLQAEAERCLYRSSTLPAQSTIAPAFLRRSVNFSTLEIETWPEADTWPTEDHRWDFRREQQRAAWGTTGILHPAWFKLPQDAFSVPQPYVWYQGIDAYAEVEDRQAKCASFLHRLEQAECRAQYVQHVTLGKQQKLATYSFLDAGVV